MSNRISSSILRQYTYNMNTGSSQYDVSEIITEVENAPLNKRREALQTAQARTYTDLPPMEKHKKVPYFIKGTLFEQIVTGKYDTIKDRIITFKDLRSKKSKQDVASKIEEVGTDALLVSDNNLSKLMLLCDTIHARQLPQSLHGMLQGRYPTIGDLLLDNDVIYSYRFDIDILLGSKLFNMTGECDGLVPIELKDGVKSHLLLEIKTSSKLYYANHMNNIIRNMSYDFQVMFYTAALQRMKMNPLTHTMFLMANPSTGVFGLKAYDTMNETTRTTFKRIMRSLYEL